MAAAVRPAARPLIVVVEDDVGLRGALKFAFELEGYDVLLCESGEDLLEQTLPKDWACLVLDERLPGLGGLAVLGELRRREVRLPAVLITTNPTASLRQAAATAKVPIVEKPLLGDSLLGKIREVLIA